MTLNLEDFTVDQDTNGDLVVTYTPTNTVIERIDSGNEEKILEVATQISTLKDATSGNQVYDSPSEELTADVNNTSVSTDRLATDYLYARSFDGADADARLSNALSAVSAGQTIYLEPATYTASASISTTGVRLIGSGGRAQTSVDANWTVDTPNVDINEVTWLSQSSGDVLTVNGVQLRMVGCDSTGNIQVADDDCIILGLSGGSVTFASGTGGGVVDGSTGVSVTDDGTNTVGTIG